MSPVTCLPNEFECATGYGCLDPALYCNVAGECMDRSDENVDLCGKIFNIPPNLPYTENQKRLVSSHSLVSDLCIINYRIDW